MWLAAALPTGRRPSRQPEHLRYRSALLLLSKLDFRESLLIRWIVVGLSIHFRLGSGGILPWGGIDDLCLPRLGTQRVIPISWHRSHGHQATLGASAQNHAIQLPRILFRTQNQEIELGTIQQPRQNVRCGRGCNVSDDSFLLGSGGDGNLGTGALLNSVQDL